MKLEFKNDPYPEGHPSFGLVRITGELKLNLPDIWDEHSHIYYNIHESEKGVHILDRILYYDIDVYMDSDFPLCEREVCDTIEDAKTRIYEIIKQFLVDMRDGADKMLKELEI